MQNGGQSFTKQDLKDILNEGLDERQVATKRDLSNLHTELRSEYKQDFSTLGLELKQGLKNFATKQDFADLRSESRHNIQKLGAEFKQDLTYLRSESRQDVSNLRAELKQDISDAVTDMSNVIKDAMQVIAVKLDQNEKRDAKRWRANVQAHIRTQAQLDKLTGMVY